MAITLVFGAHWIVKLVKNHTAEYWKTKNLFGSIWTGACVYFYLIFYAQGINLLEGKKHSISFFPVRTKGTEFVWSWLHYNTSVGVLGTELEKCASERVNYIGAYSHINTYAEALGDKLGLTSPNTTIFYDLADIFSYWREVQTQRIMVSCSLFWNRAAPSYPQWNNTQKSIFLECLVFCLTMYMQK